MCIYALFSLLSCILVSERPASVAMQRCRCRRTIEERCASINGTGKYPSAVGVPPAADTFIGVNRHHVDVVTPRARGARPRTQSIEWKMM